MKSSRAAAVLCGILLWFSRLLLPSVPSSSSVRPSLTLLAHHREHRRLVLGFHLWVRHRRPVAVARPVFLRSRIRVTLGRLLSRVSRRAHRERHRGSDRDSHPECFAIRVVSLCRRTAVDVDRSSIHPSVDVSHQCHDNDGGSRTSKCYQARFSSYTCRTYHILFYLVIHHLNYGKRTVVVIIIRVSVFVTQPRSLDVASAPNFSFPSHARLSDRAIERWSDRDFIGNQSKSG